MVALSSEQQKFWSAALQMWRDPQARSWILVNPTSIGDSFACCALARAFKQTHGGPLTMVMKESQAPLAELYAGDIERILIYPDQQLLSFCFKLFGTGSFDIDQPIVAHPHWHGTGQDFHALIELFSYPGRGGLTFSDWFRLMLRLPWSADMALPTIPAQWRTEAEIYAHQTGVKPGKSLILFPDNNSLPPLPESFWDRLATALSEKGFTVFTNMAGNNSGPRARTLAGSKPIHVNLKRVLPLVEFAGGFISGANGLASTLLGCRAKTRHALLLHQPPEGESLEVFGHVLKHPVAMQKQHLINFCEGPFHEFPIETKPLDAEQAWGQAIENILGHLNL